MSKGEPAATGRRAVMRKVLLQPGTEPDFAALRGLRDITDMLYLEAVRWDAAKWVESTAFVDFSTACDRGGDVRELAELADAEATFLRRLVSQLKSRLEPST